MCSAACGAWHVLRALLPWALTPLAVAAVLPLAPRPRLLAQLQLAALAKLSKRLEAAA